MKGKVTARLYGRDGRLVYSATQPSRSLTIGFMKLLYVAMSQETWAGQTAGEGAFIFRTGSPGGNTLVPYRPGLYSGDLAQTYFNGECFGIQISSDDEVIGPYTNYIRGQIGRHIGYWRFLPHSTQSPATGICTNRWDRCWNFRTTTIYVKTITGMLVTSWSIASGTQDITHDATHLWSINSSDNMVRRHHPLTGDILQEWGTPATDGRGIAWDWDNNKIFTLDATAELIYRHDPADGTVEASGAVPDTGLGTRDGRMEYHDGYLWIVYGESGKRVIYKIDAATFALVDTIPILTTGYTGHGARVYHPVWPSGICRVGPYFIVGDAYYYYTGAPGYNYYYGYQWGMHVPVHDVNVIHSGTEVYRPTFSGPDGEMVTRALFTNESGGTVTVRKLGIQAGSRPELIANDVLTSPIAVGDGQILEVIYTFQIRV